MKDRLSLGIILAVLYATFVFLVPHKTPMTQEIESDFVATYIPQSQQVWEAFTFSRNAFNYDYYDSQSWDYHGVSYPLMLNAVAGLFAKDWPVRGWHYFKAGKVVSAVMGASLMILVLLAFGVRYGWIIAFVLASSAMLFNFSYSCSSDIIAAVLALWAMFFVYKGGKLTIVSGILFALCMGVRHEYVALLPVAILYFMSIFFWHGLTDMKLINFWKQMVFFLIPVILIVLPDMRSWNTSLTVPFKYVSTAYEGDKWQEDAWPPQMYTEADMDTVANYYTLQNNITKKYYPTMWSVIKIDPVRFVKIFLRDFIRSILFIIKSAWFAFIPLVIFWRKWFMYPIAAIFCHLLITNLTGVYGERYFLFDIILVSSLGLWTLLLAVSGWKYHKIVKVAILVPILLIGFTEVKTQINHNIKIGGERYLDLRRDMSIMIEETRDKTPRMICRKGQPPFIAGWDWQPWPPNLDNIYKYCLLYNVDYVMWSGWERKFRPEWNELFNNPRLAYPKFLLIEKDYGWIYYVNKADSVR